MTHLRERLAEQYAQIYARANDSIEPQAIAPKYLQQIRLTFGELTASLPTNSKVLDLGCGTGFLLYWLCGQPNIIPVGVDNSVSQLEIAKRSLPGIDIYDEDGLAFLRKHPCEFVGIFCIDVLEHISDIDSCLEWIETAAMAIQPGGFFCCRVPNAANITGSYSRYGDLTHERSFTNSSLLQLLEVTSLRDCRILPINVDYLSGRFRLLLEKLLHQAIFRICGRGSKEQLFTYNICAVGFKE